MFPIQKSVIFDPSEFLLLFFLNNSPRIAFSPDFSLQSTSEC